jgi:hypothetical protein
MTECIRMFYMHPRDITGRISLADDSRFRILLSFLMLSGHLV